MAPSPPQAGARCGFPAIPVRYRDRPWWRAKSDWHRPPPDRSGPEKPERPKPLRSGTEKRTGWPEAARCYGAAGWVACCAGAAGPPVLKFTTGADCAAADAANMVAGL